MVVSFGGSGMVGDFNFQLAEEAYTLVIDQDGILVDDHVWIGFQVGWWPG